MGRQTTCEIWAVTRLLLDTHAALFWWAGSSKLSAEASEAIADAEATIFLSTASCWEIATKFRIGKLAFVGDPQVHVPRLVAEHGFEMLPISMDHGLQAGSLPSDHRDPFDRLIAAQALIEQLIVVSRDPEIAGFGCEVLW